MKEGMAVAYVGALKSVMIRMNFGFVYLANLTLRKFLPRSEGKDLLVIKTLMRYHLCLAGCKRRSQHCPLPLQELGVSELAPTSEVTGRDIFILFRLKRPGCNTVCPLH